MKPHPQITGLFLGVWIALCIVGWWVTYLDKNIARKKRLLPVFIVGTGVTFAIFAPLITGDVRTIVLVVPAVLLIIFLNLRQIKVCPTCGRTIDSGMSFGKAVYCPKCGGRLG